MEKKLPKPTSLKDGVFMRYVLVFLTVLIVVNIATQFKPQGTPKVTVNTPELDSGQLNNISYVNENISFLNDTENLYESNFETNYHNSSYLNETDNLYETNYRNASYLNETDNLYEYNTDYYNSSYMNYSDYLYHTLHNNSYTDYNDSYYNYNYLNDTNITGYGYTYNINQTNNTYNNYTNTYYNNYNYSHYNYTGNGEQLGYNNSETIYIPDRGWENKSKNTPEDRQKLYWTIDFGHNVSEIWIIPLDESVFVSFDAYIGNAQYINTCNYYGFFLTDSVNKFEITTDCMTLYAQYGEFSTYWDKYLSASVYIIVFGNW